jgi:plasmid maintenance system antidote protein VapI
MKESNHYLNALLAYLKQNSADFAKNLGLSRVDRIYHVLNGRNGISEDLAKLIVDKYKNINYNWLLTGEGEMLKQECQEQKNDLTNENFLKFLHEENKELNKKIWELEAENERLRKMLKTV